MNIKINRKVFSPAKKYQALQWKSFVEKRQFKRFPAIIPLSYFECGVNKINDVQTYDISVEGICVLSNKELSVGLNLEVILYVDNNKEIITRKSRIVWSQLVDNKHRTGLILEDTKLRPIPIVLKTLIALRKY
ncbi:MAG: PilZ domain-containing protein [Candidatus Omnitrophota bacterium]